MYLLFFRRMSETNKRTSRVKGKQPIQEVHKLRKMITKCRSDKNKINMVKL